MRRTKPRRLLKLGLAIVLLPVLAAGLCYGKWIALDNRLVTVTPGAIYQSAAFEPDDLVATCRDHGIKTVIDLRNEVPEAVELAAAAAEKAGITHVSLPTISHPILEQAHAFLDALAAAEPPVLVHCQHGEGRSVMMCAVHRIENEGWSNERAFDGTARLPDALRFLNTPFPALRRFRTEHTKGQFVLNYRPRKHRAKPMHAGAKKGAAAEGSPAEASAAKSTAR